MVFADGFDVPFLEQNAHLSIKDILTRYPRESANVESATFVHGCRPATGSIVSRPTVVDIDVLKRSRCRDACMAEIV